MPPTRSTFAVLVVEDEPLLLMDAVTIFEDAGYTVYSASSGERAIELLETCPDIRVLFTDVEMAGSVDGLELARIARDRWPPVEVVVVSGRVKVMAHEIPERAVFLAKPYQPAIVLATVDQFIAAA